MSTPLERASSQNFLKVLIVDDDAVDRMAVQRALQGSGFKATISEAADADTALDILQGSQSPDCIFVDYNLPGKNGLELIRHIRHREIKVPVIALTGQGNEQTAVELMKAGALDYLPKSKLSPHEIARSIRGTLRIFQAEMATEEASRALREKNSLLEKTNRELERQRHYIYRQNLKLQEVSRLKSEFLATMSHELRTPLNAIIGFSQILLSKNNLPMAKNQQDMLSRVLANGRNLLELINDILAFSKIEAGRLELEPAAINLEQLVKTSAGDIKSLATQKSLDLNIDVALNDPMVVNDAGRFRQVLVNLLSNAIKFTQSGHIKVTVRDRPAEGADHEILLSVTDTGCGISAEEQTRIFDPFRQVNQRETRQHNGTGLGLAITHSLVKMMNGNITLNSEVGEGTTFTITLPRKVVVTKVNPSFEYNSTQPESL